jgi:hypothetical protein
MSTIPSKKDFVEGDIVSYTAEDGQEDTARVRRVYDDCLELVNRERGYQSAEKNQVIAVVGEIIPGTYDCRPK